MSVKRQITESEGLYFITITCFEWLPLFELCNGYDIVYKWFDYLKQKGHFIPGYVIMPNHIHVLIAFTRISQSINTVIGNGKRFMAYEIVKRLKEKGDIEILNRLADGVTRRDYNRGKLHELFEPSFDWKECRSNKFINQKLNYIHNNPCSGKWNLADSPVNYVHSSAKFYLTGEHGVYEVLHLGKLEDIGLTKELGDE
jgi:REP element-mobilizing transposase RayT